MDGIPGYDEYKMDSGREFEDDIPFECADGGCQICGGPMDLMDGEYFCPQCDDLQIMDILERKRKEHEEHMEELKDFQPRCEICGCTQNLVEHFSGQHVTYLCAGACDD